MRFEQLDNAILMFDHRKEPFWPHEVAYAFYGLRAHEELTEAERHALEFEIAAWEMRAKKEAGGVWGRYFEPLQLGRDQDGSPIYRPELASFGQAAVEQWKGTLHLATHPFLRARYAHLLWDLSHVLLENEQRDIESGQMAIECYLEQASTSLNPTEIESVLNLERAFQIAAEMNDQKRTARVLDRLFELAEQAPLKSIGVWSIPSRCILSTRKLLATREVQLTQLLERRLQEAAIEKNGYASEFAVNALANIYTRNARREDRERIFMALAQTFEAQAENAPALTAIHWLSDVVKALEKERLRAEADRLQLKIEQLGKKALGEMHTFTTETSIPRKEVEESIDSLIAVNDPFLALYRLAAALSPKCDELRVQIKEQENDFIHLRLFSRTLIGGDGLPKATIGNSENDPEGRMFENSMHFLPFNTNVFYLGYGRAKERFGFVPADLVNKISGSSLCSSEILASINRGVEAYDSGDYRTAISFLIPQIEVMLRGILRLLELPISKRNRRTEFTEQKNMSDVLMNNRVGEDLEEDLVFFLRLVFADPRGWNLRNEFAHGVLPEDAFNVCTASAVIMALMRLAMIGPHGIYLASSTDGEDIVTD